MLLGVVAGLITGAFWGMTFVAPTAVRPYSELDLAILRYLAFGATSLALMALSVRFRPGPIGWRRALMALWLGLTGYVTYYLFVAFAVRYSGPAIAPLIIGLLPVLLPIYANWRDKTVPWRLLAAPLAIIAVGLGLINAAALAQAATAEARREVWFGVFLATCALIVWLYYAVLNAKAMRAPDAPSALGWTSLQGLGAMAGVLPLVVLAPLMGWSEIPSRGFAGLEGASLLLWGVATGVLGSWVAQYFWTLASKRLPLALSAQLIVSETVFGLIYGFLWQGRWPFAQEWLGAGLLLTGVMLGVHLFTRKPGGVAH
jgi:drug/metabolite transporter (DMT)-like permease